MGNYRRKVPGKVETEGKSLSFGNFRVTGISCGSGNLHVKGITRILRAITSLSDVQIAFWKKCFRAEKIFLMILHFFCF